MGAAANPASAHNPLGPILLRGIIPRPAVKVEF